MITGDAAFAAVLGHPVAHSLSPRLHGFWLAQYEIDAAYIPLSVPPGRLRETLRGLAEAENFRGCNLTIPHKEAALEIVDALEEEAKIIGAVNTVVAKGGELLGRNTDAYGFRASLEAAFADSPHGAEKHKAVVYGAGGAACAVVQALKTMGYQAITLCNRSQGRAETLALRFGAPLTVASWEQREAVLENASLLVNTTSLGLGGESVEWDLKTLPRTAWVSDIVYKPLITPLLAAARARKNPIVDGIGMLLHQAVPAFEAWFGVRPLVTHQLRKFVLGL